MLLSRVFSLIFGTTLFVLIWTMQDGNHRATRVARSSGSKFVGTYRKPTFKGNIKPRILSTAIAPSKSSRGYRAEFAAEHCPFVRTAQRSAGLDLSKLAIQ